MIQYKEIRNSNGNIEKIETNIFGSSLLNEPRLNKSTAFSLKERVDFNLIGLLPYNVERLEDQVHRAYIQYQEEKTPLLKNIYLNSLLDTNETLFYFLVRKYLSEMLPIIYTPTVGEAVEHFSMEFRRSRGIYISYPYLDKIRKLLKNRAYKEVDLIVVTDGEGILGIGDHGIGGMDISIAKLAVYTLSASVDPNKTLPIQLDVGTNNLEALHDPTYNGWRHNRITGSKYDDFIKEFVKAVKNEFPNIYLHWEDFGRQNARKNLDKFRNQICSFNDDIQGTGAVALACVLAAEKISKKNLCDQKVVIFGAGTAGVGIADQICDAMQKKGLSKKDALSNFYLIDRDGLLLDNMNNLLSFQKPYAFDHNKVTNWQLEDNNKIQLFDVIKNVRPDILIGCSTVSGAFTEKIIKQMYKYCPRPLIMPLSNPTSKAEAHPISLMKWTDKNALIATGSPFKPVDFNGKTYRISQSNNAFIFPGLGLGSIVAKAKKVTDNMIWTACKELASCSPAILDKDAPLLPDLDKIVEVSHKIAINVAKQTIKDGVAGIDNNLDIEKEIAKKTWEPKYYDYVKI